MKGWSWQDVEVPAGGEDAAVVLHGDIEARARELGVEVAVSLTHTRTYAGAVAVLR
jgi:phosphopantetheinyl transferase (holo-ACP synthase)